MHSVSLTLAERLSLPSYKAGCNAGRVTNATQHNTNTHKLDWVGFFFFFYIWSKRAGKGRGGRKWNSKVYIKVLVWETCWIVGELAANKIANQPACCRGSDELTLTPVIGCFILKAAARNSLRNAFSGQHIKYGGLVSGLKAPNQVSSAHDGRVRHKNYLQCRLRLSK